MKRHNKVALGAAFCFFILIIILRITGVAEGITLERIQDQATQLRLYVHDHYALSVLLFIAAYTVIGTLALPLASIATVTGGYLFGMYEGALYTNIGATLGGIVVFLLVRYSIGHIIRQRYTQKLRTFDRRFQKQGALFLLAARLIVLFPYFMVNMFAGLTNVSLWTFVWTTAVGIIPASLVFTFAGQQLHTIDSVQDIFTPHMLIALAALALLLFVPSLYRRFKASGNDTL